MIKKLENKDGYWCAQIPELHDITKKITKGDILSYLDYFLDNYTRGLLEYKIEFIQSNQAIHIKLRRGDKCWSHYASADFCEINLFVYLEDIFLELYKMLGVPNAEEEYKKRKLFLNI